MGFWVGRKFWNRGIATEAVRKTIEFGFDRLKLHRIQGDNDSDNSPSGFVMKKAGMKSEGIREKFRKEGNKFIDLELWGITN